MTKTVIKIDERKDHYLSYELKLWKKMIASAYFHNGKFGGFAFYPDKVPSSNMITFDKKFKVADIRTMGQRLIDLADKIEAEHS